MSMKPDDVNNERKNRTEAQESLLAEDRIVTVNDTWTVAIPEGYKYCTDKSIISEHRDIVIMEDAEGNDFKDPANASVSFISVFNEIKNMSAHQMAKMIVEEKVDAKESVLKDEENLYVAYYYDRLYNIDGQKLETYIIQIGCGSGISTIQVFFNDSELTCSEQRELVETIANTIELSPSAKVNIENSIKSGTDFVLMNVKDSNVERGRFVSRISMITGIVGVVLSIGSFFFLSSDNILTGLIITSSVCAIVAIVLALIAYKKGEVKKRIIAGLILGLITIVFWIALFIIGIVNMPNESEIELNVDYTAYNTILNNYEDYYGDYSEETDDAGEFIKAEVTFEDGTHYDSDSFYTISGEAVSDYAIIPGDDGSELGMVLAELDNGVYVYLIADESLNNNDICSLHANDSFSINAYYLGQHLLVNGIVLNSFLVSN